MFARTALHSNLVLFKSIVEPTEDDILYLYIPIWFYSNDTKVFLAQIDTAFTFQSGSIQMTVKYFKTMTLICFTFQSGSIQIKKTNY